MEVILAENAGFCFGVKRAVDKVYEQIEQNADGRKIYTYGPIIHNREVVEDLRSKGVEVIEEKDQIPEIAGQILIIRSHGVAREIYDLAARYDIKIIDATCPFVKKIHNIVSEKGNEGYHVVIAGDPSHPEVQGIVGWLSGTYTVINIEEDAEDLSIGGNEKICIVAQTTFNAQKFKHFVEIISKKGYDTNVINTICNATAIRQCEAAEISMKADKMLVIGDPRSSNTRKLYEICKSNCNDTYHIQTVKDLASADLRSGTCVGITAGASTPHYLIQEVLFYVRGNHFQ